MKKTGTYAILGFLYLIIAANGLAEDTGEDLNYYYRFPISAGFEYQVYSPFGEYSATFNIFDLSISARIPIPGLPILQPTAKAGVITFDSLDAVDPLKLDHNHWYGALGLGVAHRFAKTFEVGGDVAAGFSQSFFKNLYPDAGTVGSPNLLFEAGARISLDPSYNFSIDVHPNLKYIVSLGPFTDFNGLIFAVGFAAHYRFGQDPDSSGAKMRSIRFGAPVMPPVFAAMQSYYVTNPVGSIQLTNVDTRPVTDISVSFFQAGYMDSPTPVATIKELAKGESASVDLFASFNEKIFLTEGITPLTGEVLVTYRSTGKVGEQKQPITYDLYDKTSIIWDDSRKVAAFITPADNALKNYTSFIRQSCREATKPGISGQLQLAMQVFGALGEIGCLYQSDPILPFSDVQNDSLVVDSVSLPRNTLARITGDCDDLTVLFNSLLETAGTETGFITVPGHIFSAFNTGTSSREYAKVHPDRGMTIMVDGELWIPVEITLIGRASFMDAWVKGAEEWRSYEKREQERKLYRTLESQETYRAVGLKQTDLGLQYGQKENIVETFISDVGQLIDVLISVYQDKAESSGKKSHYNKLGITYATYGRLEFAKEAFATALSLDPNYLSATINLGNVLFLTGEYELALTALQDSYTQIMQSEKGDSAMAGKVLLNLANTLFQLDRLEEADSFLHMAREIAPIIATQYDSVVSNSSSADRAASIQTLKKEIIFIDDL